FDQMSHRMRSRSTAVLLAIDTRLHGILKYWLLVAGLLAALRIALSSGSAGADALSTFSSYMLVVVAPFVSTLLALRWFRDGYRQAQPEFRLAQVGRWTNVSRAEAQRHALYGTSGIMVSLLVGMMMNVPVRA